MMESKKTVVKFLEKLGLTKEEATLYLALLRKGELTTLELARASGIERTKVYRLLEKLKKQGVIEEVVEEKKRVAKAVGLHKLDLLVREEEAKVKFLRESLPDIKSIIAGSSLASQPGTKVLFYRGVEGIKQMVWNVLRADGEAVGYTYRALREIVSREFAVKWRDEFTLRKLYFRDIYSDVYLSSVKHFDWEDISYPTEYFGSRYVPSNILNINHQTDIYNDVVSYYKWHEGEIFGVEIYNKDIAQVQKQLFEIVWEIATPEEELKKKKAKMKKQ